MPKFRSLKRETREYPINYWLHKLKGKSQGDSMTDENVKDFFLITPDRKQWIAKQILLFSQRLSQSQENNAFLGYYPIEGWHFKSESLSPKIRNKILSYTSPVFKKLSDSPTVTIKMLLFFSIFPVLNSLKIENRPFISYSTMFTRQYAS